MMVNILNFNSFCLSNYFCCSLHIIDVSVPPLIHSDWGKAFSQRYEQLPDPNTSLDRNKILKVGYVSADMSTHSVAYFSEVFLRDMDPRQIQLFIYSNSPVIDNTTKRLMSYPNLTWRQIEG